MIKIDRMEKIHTGSKIVAMSLAVLMTLSLLTSMLVMINPVEARDEPIPGDIVVRYSRYDTPFGSIQGWIPGHVGIYIGNGKVIDAVPPVVRETTLDNFKTENGLGAYKGAKSIPGLTDMQRSKIVQFAKEHVGDSYNLWPYNIGPHSWNCVEFAEAAYENAGANIFLIDGATTPLDMYLATTPIGRLPFPNCDDGNPDTVDIYNSQTGQCEHIRRPPNDRPDDTFDVSTPSSNTASFSDESGIAILKNGFSVSFSNILSELGEYATLVGIDFSPSIVNEYPILIIPSGGLYGLDSSSIFNDRLKEYVEKGGTIIVFAQQHGYEYNALPCELLGFGWLEDQNCHYHSVGISTYHPILSGQESVISDANVDGFFTKYPENATILLSRTKNGMPAMLMYEYGSGRVIATTLYTDFAYTQGSMGPDEVSLIGNLIAWIKAPQQTPEVGVGDTLNLSINVTNAGGLVSDQILFILQNPTKAYVDTVNISDTMQSRENKTINFTYTVPSKLGYWTIDYWLINTSREINKESDCIYIKSDVKRFTVSKYAENPDGFVYHGKDITFTVTSPKEHYAYGSDVPFTIHIWNKGDTDRTISFSTHYKDWSLRTKLPEQNVEGSLDVPAGGAASFTHTLHVGDISLSHNQLIIYASFSEGGSGLGRTEKVVYMFSPSVNVHVETGQSEYVKGEDVSVLLNLTNKRSAVCNATVTVRTLDPDNNKVFEDAFDANLSAYESLTKTLSFTLPITSEHGIYLVAVEAYSDGRKIGSGSTYFEVMKGCMIKMTFDKPDKAYKVRENMNVDLEVKNVGSALWSSAINISIPSLAFEDSKYVSLNPNETKKFSYNLNIPETTPARKHDVIVTISFDNAVKKYYFVIPDSKLIISPEKMNYNAGDYFSINVTNTGGVDTNYHYSIKLRDSRGFIINECEGSDAILSGETKDMGFNISNQTVDGGYYLLVKVENIYTNQRSFLSKYCTIAGIKAFLSSNTDKNVYFKNENITAIIRMGNENAEIKNANLKLEVFKSLPTYQFKFISYIGEGEGAIYTPRDVAIDHNGYIYVLCRSTVKKFNSTGNVISSWGGRGSGDGQFGGEKPYGSSEGIALDNHSFVYVMDTDNNRVQKFDSNGNFITKWGRSGTGDGEFQFPRDIAVDSQGFVYVPDFNNHRIQKFDNNGNFITKWGSYGTGEGQFRNPKCIDVDSQGFVYIVDYRGRIQKFNGDGNFISKWECGESIYSIAVDSQDFVYLLNGSRYILKFDSNGTLITSWKAVSGWSIGSISMDEQGFVYITDINECWLEKYDNNGNPITKFGSGGSTEGKFRWPVDIDADDRGFVYVVDEGNHRIQKFTSAGNFITTWGSRGYADGQFNYPSGIAIDNQGFLFVIDAYTGDDRIQKFDNNGNFITKFGSRVPGDGPYISLEGIAIDDQGFIYVTDQANDCVKKIDSNGNFIIKWGSGGSGDGQFDDPEAIAIDVQGFVYTVERRNNRIQKFDSNGNFITKWGSEGSGDGQFDWPRGIVVDNQGFIYVADYRNNRVQQFDGDGNFIIKWGSEGSGDGQFEAPCGIAVGTQGFVYVGDFNPRVQKFGMETAEETLQEKDISIDSLINTQDISIDIGQFSTTGKLLLRATLYSNTSQIIDWNISSFYLIEGNTSLTLKAKKKAYKPGETINIQGDVKNYADIADNYNLSIKSDGTEIFSDSFALNPNQTYHFTTNTISNASFTLEGTINGVVVTDFVRVESPNINVSVIAPDVVGISPFNVAVLIENIGGISADLNVSINSTTWNITIPEGELRLLETTMSITKNTTLNVTISGDVNQTIQKEIYCGENSRINITPQPTYLEGTVEIPYTIENIGILDSEFNATFSIDNQTISRRFFVPEGENITDSISFNLTKGAYLLRYVSPFEAVNVTINVLSPPEFVVTSIYPEDMNFTLGQNVILVFDVENTGGTEGEATLRLEMPDFEDTNRTWVRPGAEENISFNLSIPDDLEEKNYKGIYELEGNREEFRFFVQGAKISVDASLDKPLYEEGETAILTLNVDNERNIDLSLYSRVKFNEYDSVQNFTLHGLGSKTLTFNVPVNFTGDNKMLYTIYMDTGRALYINSMYVYEKKPEVPMRLYTDKDVYNMGENVTLHIIDVTKTDVLNLTAPGYTYNDTISGPTMLEFTLPELRSGTYYIEYTFGNPSSAYPFDVVGYSARVLEASLDKEEYRDGDTVKLKLNIEANRNVSGLLRTWIYDSENELVDEIAMNKTLMGGENEIEISRFLSTNKSGIHGIVYGFYADLCGHGLTMLVSGAEYFDAETGLETLLSCNISLSTGWNLISAPLNLTTWELGDESVVGNPLNVSPKNSLTSIYRYNTTSGLFEKCDHFDDWGWWQATGSESFTKLEPGRGYWVMAKNDCFLTFTGTPPSDLNIGLDAGWNLIGWYSVEEVLLGEEAMVGNPLNVTPKNSLTSIYRYNTTSSLFEKCDHFDDWGWWQATGSENFTKLEPGRGYWVMAKNDCEWRHRI